jgi:hypothetical protein
MRHMSDERERFTKVLALAMHPETIPGEALAAFHRARELVKSNPKLTGPPVPPTAATRKSAPEASYSARISSVHPDWVLIVVSLLSERAYKLDLKCKITFDFSGPLTAIELVWSGSKQACDGQQRTVEWVVNYVNKKVASRR